jgi:hypothetical protein
MRWLPLLILVAIALALLRVYLTSRRRRAARPADWAAKRKTQQRAQGRDTVAAPDVDLFF